MKKSFILVFMLLAIPGANGEELKMGGIECKTATNGGATGIVCLDENNFAFIFSEGNGTIVVDMTTGDFIDLSGAPGGNIYATPEKKSNFWDKLGNFGKALEEGFANDRQAPESNDDLSDPLCVTQLQRRQNKCDD